jgi:molecular chaperone DnaJ
MGTTLQTVVKVPMTAAALGTHLMLPTLEADLPEDAEVTAREIDLEIKPGTQSGTETILRGHGVPGLRGHGRGDLVVTVLVETPSRLDARQEELLRELAALRNEENPSGTGSSSAKGVFGRLRDAFNQH